MAEVTTASIRHEPGEEHILRRLGGAVIVHWAGLPEAMRDVLVNQASAMSDREAALIAEFRQGGNNARQ